MNARDDYPELFRIAQGHGVEILEDAEMQAGVALDELDGLRRWKREGIIALGKYDDAFDRLKIEGHLGESKAEVMAQEIERLRAEADRLGNYIGARYLQFVAIRNRAEALGRYVTELMSTSPLSEPAEPSPVPSTETEH